VSPEDLDFWDDDEWGDYDGDNPPPLAFDEPDDGRPSIQEILEDLGRSDIGQIVVNLRDVEDASLIRADRFSSVEDAIYFLYDLGVLSFSDVVEIEFNVYTVAIPDDTQ
jgi:hypothetical protein